MNVFGTKEYLSYQKACRADFSKAERNINVSEHGEYRVVAETYTERRKDESGIVCEKRTSVISVFIGNKKIYGYENNDYEFPPFFFEYGGQKLMFCKRELYGYTILNLDTMTEHNYFPSGVLCPDKIKTDVPRPDGDDSPVSFGEAFIITPPVRLFNDILILEGCYWGFGYGYRALSLRDYKTLSLSSLYGIIDTVDDAVCIEKDRLPIGEYFDINGNRKSGLHIFYNELKKRLDGTNCRDI